MFYLNCLQVELEGISSKGLIEKKALDSKITSVLTGVLPKLEQIEKILLFLKGKSSNDVSDESKAKIAELFDLCLKMPGLSDVKKKVISETSKNMGIAVGDGKVVQEITQNVQKKIEYNKEYLEKLKNDAEQIVLKGGKKLTNENIASELVVRAGALISKGTDVISNTDKNEIAHILVLLDRDEAGKKEAEKLRQMIKDKNFLQDLKGFYKDAGFSGKELARINKQIDDQITRIDEENKKEANNVDQQMRNSITGEKPSTEGIKLPNTNKIDLIRHINEINLQASVALRKALETTKEEKELLKAIESGNDRRKDLQKSIDKRLNTVSEELKEMKRKLEELRKTTGISPEDEKLVNAMENEIVAIEELLSTLLQATKNPKSKTEAAIVDELVSNLSQAKVNSEKIIAKMSAIIQKEAEIENKKAFKAIFDEAEKLKDNKGYAKLFGVMQEMKKMIPAKMTYQKIILYLKSIVNKDEKGQLNSAIVSAIKEAYTNMPIPKDDKEKDLLVTNLGRHLKKDGIGSYEKKLVEDLYKAAKEIVNNVKNGQVDETTIDDIEKIIARINTLIKKQDMPSDMLTMLKKIQDKMLTLQDKVNSIDISGKNKTIV